MAFEEGGHKRPNPPLDLGAPTWGPQTMQDFSREYPGFSELCTPDRGHRPDPEHLRSFGVLTVSRDLGAEGREEIGI